MISDDLSICCFLLLKGKAILHFPFSTSYSQSGTVVVCGTIKTPKEHLRSLPMSFDWFVWKFAVVPAMKDEYLDPTNPMNKSDDELYISRIKELITSNLVSIKIIPP